MLIILHPVLTIVNINNVDLVVVDARVVTHCTDCRQFHQSVKFSAFHLLAAGKAATNTLNVNQRCEYVMAVSWRQ